MTIPNSVLTNPSSFTALRTLNTINRRLDTAEARVSTGLKVTGAVDNASAFAVAQGIRGELKALDAVVQGINSTQAVGYVALAGAEAISDLLSDIRVKLTELSNQSITTTQRTIIKNDFDALLSQASNFVSNAVFNGKRLLTGATNVNTLSNLSGGTLSLTAQQQVGLRITSLAAAIVGTATNAQSVLTAQYSNLESFVNTALGSLGEEVRALQLQTTFLETLRDAADVGLGNIVDADLARESANLTSARVQQELAVQTLSIANQRPQFLLGLFR